MRQTAPQRESMGWVLCFEDFYLSLAGILRRNLEGILREVSGEVFSRMFISFPGATFQS